MDYEQLILSFTSIVYEALPFIVLGVLIAGLLEEFVPQQALAKIIPSNRFLAIALGCMLGLVFPMCECGIIVVMKRLLRKGLPLSVCVGYMLAGPVINGIVMVSTYVAFDTPQERDYILGGPLFVVAWRVGMAYVVAFVTALIVDWQWRTHGTALLHPSIVKGLKSGPTEEEAEVPFSHGRWDLIGILQFILWLGPIGWVARYLYVQVRYGRRTISERLNNITKTALNDFVDIMAFLVLGAVLAAGGKALLRETGFERFVSETPAVAIPLMMLIAVLFCLCSEADAFVAANFSTAWPPASKLAFLVLGPMLDLKLILMYTRVFRLRLILTITVCVVVQVFVYSMLVHYFF